MGDPRASILASVAKAQSTFEPTPGAALVVGVRQAFVGHAEPDGVVLRYEDGLEESVGVESLRGRAVAVLELAHGSPPSLIDQAWDIARAKDVPSDVRAGQLGELARRASAEDASTMRAWSIALLTGKSPVRTAP